MRRFYFAILMATSVLGLTGASTSAALAIDERALDDQMMRMIQLEALNDWCTDAYVDYDRLREAIQIERTKARAMTDSEPALRSSYARAKQVFLLGARDTAASYCDEMYWLRNRQEFTILRAIFHE
jgi:hypothetical protein